MGIRYRLLALLSGALFSTGTQALRLSNVVDDLSVDVALAAENAATRDLNKAEIKQARRIGGAMARVNAAQQALEEAQYVAELEADALQELVDALQELVDERPSKLLRVKRDLRIAL